MNENTNADRALVIVNERDENKAKKRVAELRRKGYVVLPANSERNPYVTYMVKDSV